MKIVFMGTPHFSAVVLEKLNSCHPVSAVVTGVDKVSGRGQKLIFCELKNKAIELGIPVLQFDKVSKTGIETIKALKPDLIVTAAFGQILSDEFLAIAPYGVLNVHASLLPKYRGSSPIQQAIIDGETETGITIMKTVREVDAGDVLLQMSTPIGKCETAGELFDRLSVLGGDAIVKAVDMLKCGNAVFVPQDETKVSRCKMFKKQDGKIDFSKTAHEIDCFVRGMNPWPSAFTYLDGKMLKVWEVECVENFELNEEKISSSGLNSNGKIRNGQKNTSENIPNSAQYSSEKMPNDMQLLDEKNESKYTINKDFRTNFGEVLVASSKDGLVVACKNGAIKLLKIQAENSKAMTSEDFLRGRSIELGTILK